MKNNRAALRYAKAALSIALDQGTADAFEQDMIGIVEVCSANKDFIAFLENPILSTETKKYCGFRIMISENLDYKCEHANCTSSPAL